MSNLESVCISSEKDYEDTFFHFCEDTSFPSLDE